MNINFGLMPPLTGPKVKKGDRKQLYTDRARAALAGWVAASDPASAVEPADGRPFEHPVADRII